MSDDLPRRHVLTEKPRSIARPVVEAVAQIAEAITEPGPGEEERRLVTIAAGIARVYGISVESAFDNLIRARTVLNETRRSAFLEAAEVAKAIEFVPGGIISVPHPYDMEHARNKIVEALEEKAKI